jgi:hypothetical protein
MTAICPALTWADSPADQAFIAGDYASAKSIWTNEAAEGSAEAMLGLGLLADRGHGQSRDLGIAYDWYLKAAQAGLAEAQFNVAVMHDAGLGRPRDAKAAQIWYTRAALRGHARAQYNLALLFETGDGLVANPQLASYWFDRAASDVPAAASRTRTPAPAVDTLVTPKILYTEQRQDSLEVIWSAPPSVSATYVLEAVAVPEDETKYPASVFSVPTNGSGLIDSALPAPSADIIWRVLNLSGDQTDYAASEWVLVSDRAAPDGRITLLYDPGIAAMADASAYFAETLRSAGFWVRTGTRSTDAVNGVYVGYSYAADSGFAQKVADFLPFGPVGTSIRQVDGLSQPGEIIIDLAAFR